MARAAPIVTAFNNGEVSPYLYGRVDVDKYALSLRECTNLRPLVQGPITKRDGSRFVVPVANESEKSRLFEFQFNPTQGYIIEMNSAKVRFLTNRGLVVETEKTVTAFSKANPAIVTSNAHGFSNGDQVVFTQVGPFADLANRVLTVASAATNTFALSGLDSTAYPNLSGTVKVARVYKIAAIYSADDLGAVTYVQSADVLYLFHPDYQTRKLVRSGATSWAFEAIDFKDGPYLTEDESGTYFTLSGVNRLTPKMTSNSAPSGTVAASDGASSAFNVFDGDLTSYYQSSSETGWLSYQPATPTIADAYWLTAPKKIHNYNLYDKMPTVWTFEGYNGSVWVPLDKQQQDAWAPGETRFFPFANKIAFQRYRINWTANNNDDESDEHSAIAEFGINVAGDSMTPVTLTASNVAGINGGAGFQTTDIGRTIRFKGSDGRWRWARITGRSSPTVVSVRIYGPALPDLGLITHWRLGMYSDTTGWPSCGTFYRDRFTMSGPRDLPHYVCCSRTGVYDEFSPSEDDGTVAADDGFAYPLLEREVRGINSMIGTQQGLVVLTTAGEGVLGPATSTEPFSATNIQANWPTSYGSCAVRPMRGDVSTLFLQREAKRLREFAFSIEANDFRAPNMSVMADHISGAGFDRNAMMRAPETVWWGVRADGRLIGFTYEREQNVTAWHQHPLGGTNAVVEDVAVICSPDGTADDVWLAVSRTINGQTHRYIEYIGDFFTHDTDQASAVFSDAAITYDGDPATVFYGLSHLEGETVRILADGVQVASQTVSGGKITLTTPASKVTIGLGYTARLWTLRPNVGAADGTAQGKLKRIFKFAMRLYRSLGGVLGSATGDLKSIPYRTIDQSITQPLDLFSGDIGPLNFPGRWETDGGTVIENDTAYPFTITAYMPRVDTEDGG